MTNEELAALVRDGDRDALLTLWGNVRRLAWSQLKRWAWACQQAGMEPEDCEQCALLALWAAAVGFDPEKGAFSTWFTIQLRRWFFEFAGLRTEKQAGDPLRTAGSLDVPASPDASEDLCLADVIPDPAAEEALEHADLRLSVWSVVEELTAAEQAAVWTKFYADGSPDPRTLAGALRALRHPCRSKRLRALMNVRKETWA